MLSKNPVGKKQHTISYHQKHHQRQPCEHSFLCSVTWLALTSQTISIKLNQSDSQNRPKKSSTWTILNYTHKTKHLFSHIFYFYVRVSFNITTNIPVTDKVLRALTGLLSTNPGPWFCLFGLSDTSCSVGVKDS